MSQTPEARARSGLAIGFTYFAALMMLMVGTFHAIMGFAGILENEFFVVTRNYAFEFDATAWGWIHLIAGVIVVFAAVGLFSGSVWARTVGITMAVISAIANFGFIPYYPVWSIVIIALDIAVIWALAAHGRDISASR
ncbi:MAG: DUF7144 family membrane protein [Actinomycetota bacterium]